MEEIWKPIPWDNGYEVSNYGNIHSYYIRGKGNKRSTSPYKMKTRLIRGYNTVNLFDHRGGNKTFFVGALVLFAFIGERPAGYDMCHNDGDRKNDRLDNLRWDTRKNNILDQKKHGRANSKRNKPPLNGLNSHERRIARLNSALTIIEMHKSGKSINSIARELKLSVSWVSRLVRGQRRNYLLDKDARTPITVSEIL